MEKNKKSPWSLRNVKWFFLFAGLAGSEMLMAQQSLETLYRVTGAAITDLFEPQRQTIQKCSAVIYHQRKEIAYGVVVSKDGYILTKASEIEVIDGLDISDLANLKSSMPGEPNAGSIELSVRVDKESFEDVKVISVDPLWDVALLKVEAQDLTPAEYAPDSKLEQGTWVVVNGATSRTKRRVLAGIISAKPREIPTAGGAGLGLALEIVKDKLEVKQVYEEGGAKVAGVLAGDLVFAIDDKKVIKLEEIAKILKDRKVGDEVKLTVRRAEKNLDLKVKLAPLGEMERQPDRNDEMSGDFSKRRSGFPRIIQHDILANSETMGGPVLDMKGRVVGMNIARANRAETFAIPVEELQELTKRLVEQTGR